MDFDKLSRGDQYKVLRIRDAENAIIMLTDFINTEQSLLDRYLYTLVDEERIRRMIQQAREDIAYYRKQLVEMGGAENEDFLTESHKDSESPIGRFPGFSCTTVM